MLRRLISFILNTILFLTGLGMTLFFGYECLLCYNSHDWETTAGRVTFNAEEEVAIGDFVEKLPQVADRIPASFRDHMIKKRVVRYKYKADGEIQTNDKIVFGRLGLLDCLPIDLDKQSKEYPVDKDVEVTFDPEDPTNAVIDTSMKQEGLICMGFGVFLMIITAGSLFSRRRR